MIVSGTPPARVDGSKIRIASRTSTAVLTEFIDSLPHQKWDRKLLGWTCDLTPAAAWRVVNSREPVFECCDHLHQLAEKFAACLEDQGAVQPPARVLDLWDHQARAFGFAMAREGTLLNHWMGCGKSLVAVSLIVNRRAKQTLVLCPTMVRGVWRREFKKWAARPVEVLVLDKKSQTVAKKAEQARRFLELCEANGVPCVVVINYEAAWRPDFEKLALSQQWDAVICDESHRIKNPQSKSSKFAAKLTSVSKFRLCLSGTPLTHSPLDLFSQFRFLDPGVFGTSWGRFRDHYATTGKLGQDHIVGYKNQAEISRKMALLTHQAGKEVLTHLPPLSDHHREGELEPEAEKLYRSVEQEMFGAVRNGVVSASNALVKLLRLQQITSGHCPVEYVDENGVGTGEYHLEMFGTEKQDLLEELLGDIPQDEPVVVFCKFTEDLVRIRLLAEKTGRTYGEISGKQRDITQDSTMPEGITLMGVQIQSGGVGIDLTRACYAVYYSVGYSLGDYLQSRERCHRPGQTRATFFYHLILKGTIDEVVYAALRKRQDIVDQVLNHLKEGRPLDADAAFFGE